MMYNILQKKKFEYWDNLLVLFFIKLYEVESIEERLLHELLNIVEELLFESIFFISFILLGL